MYTPKTGIKCSCKPGVYRDNCPTCEGTGWVIDFRAIHAARQTRARVPDRKPGVAYLADMEFGPK